MNDMSGCPEGFAGPGFPSDPGPAAVAGSAARDENPRPAPEGGRRFDGLRAGVLSVTVDPESISGDEALSPYWNARCAERQSIWWLPHRIVLRGQDARQLDMSSNFREESSSFWKRTILPAGSASAASLRLSLPSATPMTAGAVVKATRRIRAYPKDPELLHELVRQQRRAYNLAVACFREVDDGLVDPRDPDLKQTVLRATIRDFVRSEVQERGGTFRSADCDEAVNAAFRSRDAVIGKRKAGDSIHVWSRARIRTFSAVFCDPDPGFPHSCPQVGAMLACQDMPTTVS